jgi:hypothetical protein
MCRSFSASADVRGSTDEAESTVGLASGLVISERSPQMTGPSSRRFCDLERDASGGSADTDHVDDPCGTGPGTTRRAPAAGLDEQRLVDRLRPPTDLGQLHAPR